MKDNTLQHQRITVPLFNIDYHLITGLEIPEMVSLTEGLFKGLNLSDVDEQTGGYTAVVRDSFHGTALFMMINLNTKNRGNITIEDTVAHEVIHLSWYILDHLGISINVDNHEIQAYLAETLRRQILAAISGK